MRKIIHIKTYTQRVDGWGIAGAFDFFRYIFFFPLPATTLSPLASARALFDVVGSSHGISSYSLTTTLNRATNKRKNSSNFSALALVSPERYIIHIINSINKTNLNRCLRFFDQKILPIF